ncbi:SDR family oxidoreductase [Amycolatopsis mongoliensis]|uniref:SDR family oxidoreductase n=1 Tax=Amycolatopsis mongoliensis TaxID=715475 RepID=A0A9Y2JZQ1_9PSEU|nr:SDR family oxidoreductase [Amycolatopsis sp. 4-36]WIY06624.1 SDR family oxidoreductase [Amycolatopsis sp. 4-36]
MFSRRGRGRLPRARPLTGRVIAVTGAGRGIGRAIAARLAAAGAAVAIGDLDAGVAEETARAIGVHPAGRLLGLSLDVTDTPSFEDFLRTVETRLGPIDVLINNAGIMWVGPFAEEPEEAALRQFDVNVHGVLRGMKLVIPGMRERGRGHVVNIASAASRVAPPGEATYAATKHAIHGYSTAVRAELHRTGVHVSVVMPGVVDTELAVGTATGPTRRLTTDQVADVVLDVVLRPRFEVFIPRQVAALTRLAALLPGRARDALHRLLVPDQLAALSDRSVRAAYEQRTRTTRNLEG